MELLSAKKKQQSLVSVQQPPWIGTNAAKSMRRMQSTGQNLGKSVVKRMIPKQINTVSVQPQPQRMGMTAAKSLRRMQSTGQNLGKSVVKRIIPKQINGGETVVQQGGPRQKSGEEALAERIRRFVPRRLLRQRLAERGPVPGPSIKCIHAAVGFFDISGFTKLGTTLSKEETDQNTSARRRSSGRKSSLATFGSQSAEFGDTFALSNTSAEMLTMQLNGMFSGVIEIIERYGGDIIKFVGDAMIVLWTLDSYASDKDKDEDNNENDEEDGREERDEKEMLGHLGLLALACAEAAIDGMADTNPSLGLHVAISVGPVYECIVGGHESKYEYFVAGPACRDTFQGVDAAKCGETVIPAHAWPSFYMAAQRANVSLSGTPFHHDNGDFVKFDYLDADSQHALAPKMLEPLPKATAAVVRAAGPFIPRPFLAALDPRRGGSRCEMRKITILFMSINHTLEEGSANESSSTAKEKMLISSFNSLQSTVLAIQKSCSEHGTVLRQFVFDDKGFVAVVCAGLPMSAKVVQDEEPGIRALLTITSLKKRKPDLIECTRFGVTSGGECLCGPVGTVTPYDDSLSEEPSSDNGRQEYAVIGNPVNLSARLMSRAKQGEILVASNVQNAGARCGFAFTSLPSFVPKGKIDPVINSRLDLNDSHYIPRHVRERIGVQSNENAVPFVDRSDAHETVRRLGLSIDSHQSCQSVIVNGGSGQGKTKFLEYASHKLSVTGAIILATSCYAEAKNRPYLAFREIISSAVSWLFESAVDTKLLPYPTQNEAMSPKERKLNRRQSFLSGMSSDQNAKLGQTKRRLSLKISKINAGQTRRVSVEPAPSLQGDDASSVNSSNRSITDGQELSESLVLEIQRITTLVLRGCCDKEDAIVLENLLTKAIRPENDEAQRRVSSDYTRSSFRSSFRHDSIDDTRSNSISVHERDCELEQIGTVLVRFLTYCSAVSSSIQQNDKSHKNPPSVVFLIDNAEFMDKRSCDITLSLWGSLPSARFILTHRGARSNRTFDNVRTVLGAADGDSLPKDTKQGAHTSVKERRASMIGKKSEPNKAKAAAAASNTKRRGSMSPTLGGAERRGSTRWGDVLGTMKRKTTPSKKGHTLILGPLTKSQIRDIIRTGPYASQPVLVDPDLIECLASRSAGNPFILLEVLNNFQQHGLCKLCQETNILKLEKNAQEIDFHVPTNVRTVIMNNFDSIGSAAQAVLRLASVQGKHIDMECLSYLYWFFFGNGRQQTNEITPLTFEVSGSVELELVYKRLIDYKFLVESNANESSSSSSTTPTKASITPTTSQCCKFQFSSDIVRRVVYNQMLASDRRSVHRQIVNYLTHQLTVYRKPMVEYSLVYGAAAFHALQAKLELVAFHFCLLAFAAAILGQQVETASGYINDCLLISENSFIPEDYQLTARIYMMRAILCAEKREYTRALENIDLSISEVAKLGKRSLLQTLLSSFQRGPLYRPGFVSTESIPYNSGDDLLHVPTDNKVLDTYMEYAENCLMYEAGRIRYHAKHNMRSVRKSKRRAELNRQRLVQCIVDHSTIRGAF